MSPHDIDQAIVVLQRVLTKDSPPPAEQREATETALNLVGEALKNLARIASAIEAMNHRV